MKNQPTWLIVVVVVIVAAQLVLNAVTVYTATRWHDHIEEYNRADLRHSIQDGHVRAAIDSIMVTQMRIETRISNLHGQ